jgi:adenylylsulfate kinase-like enzyme
MVRNLFPFGEFVEGFTDAPLGIFETRDSK